jgi:hypothetical protein
MKNYEFETLTDSNTIVLHMMDRAEKYIPRIAKPVGPSEGHFVQIHAPEGMPHELLQSLEGMMQQRMVKQFYPKKKLNGVVSVRLHDPYTLCFDCAKLWFDQKLEMMQDLIIDAMGIEEEFIEIDWASKQWEQDHENTIDDDDLEF